MPRKTAVTKQRISMFSSLKQKFSNNRNFDNLFSDSSEEAFDINKKGRNGKTLLHDACERNDLETVKLLVTGEGLDLDVADNDGYTPLHYLCKKAFLECLECIIDHSKSVNIDELFQKARRSGIFATIPSPLSVKDESGKVILHHACDKGRAHLVERLLAFHDDPNVQDNAHCTPLHYACRSGNMDIIKELIHTYKANLNIPCDSSGTVVHYACKERKLELLQMLLSCNPDLSVVYRNTRTPLHLACESGFIEGIGELLTRGSCCTAEDASGFTPMYYACQYSHVQCVECLVEKSEQGVSLLTPAVLDARNTHSDKGILHCACEVGNAKVVQWLIEAGADLSVKDKQSTTPLHLACVNHHWGCADVLLDRCIMKDTEGKQLLLPILRFASVRKDESILKHLFGVNDIALMNERGHKLLLYAIEGNLWSCVENVVQCCISSVPKDQCKSFLSFIVPYTWKCTIYSVLNKLIDLDVNLAVRDTNGYTLLHNLCKNVKLDLLSHTMKRVHTSKVKELLKETAFGIVPLALKDGSDKVILHHACLRGTGELVEMLLSFDRNVNVRDEAQCTPLYYACRRGNIGIVTKLISRGAICNAICDSCGTPLHLACSHKNMELVQILSSAAGINLDVLDHKGDTPLHIACRKGAADVVDHLCKVGANCMLKDMQGYTPIQCACAGNHWQCVLHLIDSLKKNMHDSKVKVLLEFILFSAIKCASGLSVVQKLLKIGFDFRIHDVHGFTPLYYACKGFHLDSMEYLLLHLPEEHIHELTDTGKGNNPLTIADSEGKVILHHASEKGRSKLVERIPTFGGKLNMKDKQQRTPLHYACMNGHNATVRALICKDPNLAAVKDASDFTPMHYACKNAHVSCVQSVIDIIPELQYQNLLKMSTGMIWGVTPLTIQEDRTLKVILHHACEKGMNKLVEVLLKAGANPFAPNATHTTPFHYACRNGHWDCAETLLDHCIKTKVTLPESAKSLFLLAFEKGALFTGCKLLRAGCKLESIESRIAHQTACKNYDWDKVHRLTDHCIETLSRNNAQFFLNPFLPSACERGDLFIVTWLIGIGCDVVDSEVQAALHVACENGHLECVEFIADHCTGMMGRSEVNQFYSFLSLAYSRIRIIDQSKVKQFLNSILSLAYRRSIPDSERLIGMGDADILASRGITLILSACEHGHWQCVEHLVDYCIEVMDKNTITRVLSPILPCACKDGRVELFKKLVEVGAPLTERDTNGYTCLHYLCKNGHLSGLEYLIEKYHKNPSCIRNLFQLHSWYYFGATPLTIKDESGKVILHHACQGGSEQLVQFLLSSGASPNVCDQNALTPLHTGCQHGAAEVIDALVAGGANCAAQDTVGLTPLHYACRNGHLQCVKHLIGERQQRRYLLRKYSKLFSGYSPISIKEGVSGKVVLHHACEQGDFELVKILVGAGASISVYDLNHLTPLHYAFINNHSQSGDTVEYLVHHCQETKNNSDSQEFLCAFLDQACEKGYRSVIQSLIKCDWKLSVDNTNRSPLLCAAENDHWNCVELLVDHCMSCRESGTMSEAEQEQLLDPILPLACQKNDVAIIEKLLGEDEGEEIGGRGQKLVHIACKNGHWLCVETLLDFYKRKSCVAAKFSTLLNDVIFSACKSGAFNTNIMKKLIAMGADFSIEDTSRFTPLHFLCQNAHIPCLEYLLGLEDPKTSTKLARILKSDFTPLGVKDNLGKVALHHACEKGSAHLVKRLLEHGADPDVLDGTHCTPLHYACWKEDMDIIEELLAKKPDLVNVACDASGTPLQDACAKGNVKLVEVLVSAHADLNVSDSDGCTPLHIACRGGFLDVVHRLASAHANCMAKDKYGQTPMHYASKNGHLPCVEVLINRSPNGQSLLKVPATPVSDDTPLTVHNTSGKVLLHCACEQGYIGIVKMAIEEGADPTVEDSSHLTPLHYACENNHTLCAEHMIDHCRISKDLLSQLLPIVSQNHNILLIKKLLSMGVDCTVDDAKGRSALHYACENNDVHCAECLIQHCEKVLNPPKLKEYLSKHLHTASVGDHVGIVEKLLQAGADIAVKDRNGDTAVYVAYKNNYRQCASKMIDSCLKSPTKDQAKLILNPILPLASKEGDIITVRKLCKVRIDVKEQDELGNTPLHYACKNSHLQCVQAILNTQQSRKEQLTMLQIPNKGKRTPLDIDTDGRVILHEACELGDVEVVEVLLAAGARRQARIQASGLTPVHLACCNGHTDCLEAILYKQNRTKVRVLLQLGSDLKSGITPLAVKDHYDRTVLHHACIKDRVDLVKDLISAGADPCVQDSQLYTPLMYACKEHSFLCAEYLVSNTSRPLGRLINFEACSVSPKVLTDLKDSNARTVLHYVCKAGKFALVKHLIGMDADAAAEDVDGSTPLHMACQHGRLKCVQYLLSLPQFQITNSPKYSAKISIGRDTIISALSMADGSGKVILHHACKEGNVELIEKLLTLGAPTATAVDSEGYTPLHYACQGGHVSIVQKFSDLVTLLTVKGNNGYTPLHCACESGQIECVEYLIDNHWDLRISQAVESPSPLIVKRGHGPNVFQFACQRNKAKLVAKLSKFIIDPNVEDSDGYTFPMHLAMNPIDKTVLYSILESFKEAEWTIDAKHRKTKKTALHLACESGNIDCVEFLFSNSADLCLKDCDERTPLLAACANFKHFTAAQPESVLLKLIRLLTTGEGRDRCNINAKDKKEGKTALHYSAECHDHFIPLALLDAGADIDCLDGKGQTFFKLAPPPLFAKVKSNLLQMKRHKIVCVVGYPKCGKSTLIAAIEKAQEIQGTLNEWSCEFFRREVDLNDKRTAGIVTKVVNCKSLGNIRFFDFAGHSEYYISHLAFLDSALSVKDVSVAFIMITDLRKPEAERKAECKEWLSQIKCVISDNNNSQLKVILVGSHLDTFYFWQHSHQTYLLNRMFDYLKATFESKKMHFEGFVTMNCRRLISNGSRDLQHYLASGYQSGSSFEDISPSACVLFNNLKEVKQVLSLVKIKEIHDKNSSSPSTLEYVGNLCKQLAASGLILYIEDNDSDNGSWVVVQVEDVLSDVHGTLFAPPDKQKFPKYESCLDNRFGLITLKELELGFKECKLPLQMIKDFLMTMQFCSPLCAKILHDDILKLLCDGSSGQECLEWLYFPHLVKAKEFDVPDLFPNKQSSDHWICWELQILDSDNHRFNPLLQQALFITFGAKFVESEYTDEFKVNDHSCVLLRNGIKWSIEGVDICVCVKEKSAIQVLGRSTNEKGFKPLIVTISKVVQEVFKVKKQREFCHSHPPETTSCFREVVDGHPSKTCSLLIPSVVRSLQHDSLYVSCTCDTKHNYLLSDFFRNKPRSLTLSGLLSDFFGSKSESFTLPMLKDMALESLGRMIPSLESSDIRHTPIEYTPRASEPESSDTECVKTESIPAPNELYEDHTSKPKDQSPSIHQQTRSKLHGEEDEDHTSKLKNQSPSIHQQTCSMLHGEEVLSRISWIPFGVRTLPVDPQGCLYQLVNNGSISCGQKSSGYIKIPQSAFVAENQDVHFALIIHGPFLPPSGYQFASAIVYMSFDTTYNRKPIILYLPHWYGGEIEDQTADGLTFVMAPHSLKDGKTSYQFEPFPGGEFLNHEGYLPITGHNSLFAIAFRKGGKSSYYATSLAKEEKGHIRNDVVITYAYPVWTKIFRKYCPEWCIKKTQPFSFGEGKILTVLEFTKSGPGWTADVHGTDQVKESRVSYSESGISDEAELEEAVINEVYPPRISWEVLYRAVSVGYSSPEFVRLKIAGTDEGNMNFLYEIPIVNMSCEASNGSLVNGMDRHRVQNDVDPLSFSVDSDEFFHTPPSHSPTEEQTVNGHFTGSPTTVSCVEGVPSDTGIHGIVEVITHWDTLVVNLGVPLPQVEKFRKDERWGVYKALQYWRDGRCKVEYPNTWDFLLKCVWESCGSHIAEKLKKCAKENLQWTENL